MNLRISRLVVAACAVFIHGAAAQQFSGAVVKASTPGTKPVAPVFAAGHWRGAGVSLRDYLCTAFGVSEFQVAGPEWVATDLFDLEATVPTEGDPLPELQLQRVLTEPFHLQVRRDTRLVNVYDLRVVDSGAKVKAAAGTAPEFVEVVSGKITLKHGRITRLAEALSHEARTPVVNRTQLDGVYDLILRWTPETLMRDLEEQLGLKLQPNRAQIGLLVVESAERPDGQH